MNVQVNLAETNPNENEKSLDSDEDVSEESSQASDAEEDDSPMAKSPRDMTLEENLR